ncbi:hypothetical protein C8Q79DRAFT_1071796 [Trametes meyenii]|nr:hypothetical protein C8Q79DRAFT_1071796 [Trametes meyenii]
MHLTDLNIPELLISIWRGVIKGSKRDAKSFPFAVLQDEVWTSHGREVQLTMAYLPAFFDRAPRNIAEKISSGYKAAEFHTYLWNYAPAMLRRVLPPLCWRHLCKTARTVQIIHQETIPLADLIKAKKLVSEATREFEEVYVERDADRIHFVRPCIHTLWHTPDEIVRRGSLIVGTQHVVERLIGDLGGSIRQPSNPFQNLAQLALRRCQENSIRAMVPVFNQNIIGTQLAQLPRGALDIGDGYVLLRALDHSARTVPKEESQAFFEFFSRHAPQLMINSEYSRDSFVYKPRKWARIRLPNGLVARSAWKECTKPLSKLRVARCVKFGTPGRLTTEVGEVQYYCQVGPTRHPVALVSVFGPRNAGLYADSYETVELMEYQGNAALRVIDVKSITTVVGMIPDKIPGSDVLDQSQDYKHMHVGSKYFVVEKLGLKVGVLAGEQEAEMDVDE